MSASVKVPVKEGADLLSGALLVVITAASQVVQHDSFWAIWVPIVSGALFATFLRSSMGIIGRKDFVSHIIGGILMGKYAGQSGAGILPGVSGDPLVYFVMALSGAVTVESIVRGEIKPVDWLLGHIRSLGKDKDKPRDK